MNAKMMNRLVMKMGEWFNEQYMMDDMINEQEEEVEGWMMGSVAGRVSLSTRSEDGLMNRDGSGSCWTCLSLKIGQGMKMARWTPQRTMDGSLICQELLSIVSQG